MPQISVSFVASDSAQQALADAELARANQERNSRNEPPHADFNAYLAWRLSLAFDDLVMQKKQQVIQDLVQEVQRASLAEVVAAKADIDKAAETVRGSRDERDGR